MSDHAEFANRMKCIQKCICWLVSIGMKKRIEMPTFERPVLKPVLRSPEEDGISISGCISAVDCAELQQLNVHSLHCGQFLKLELHGEF